MSALVTNPSAAEVHGSSLHILTHSAVAAIQAAPIPVRSFTTSASLLPVQIEPQPCARSGVAETQLDMRQAFDAEVAMLDERVIPRLPRQLDGEEVVQFSRVDALYSPQPSHPERESTVTEVSIRISFHQGRQA